MEQLKEWEERTEEGVTASNKFTRRSGGAAWVNLVCGGGVVPNRSELSPIWKDMRALLNGEKEAGGGQKLGSHKEVICLDESVEEEGHFEFLDSDEDGVVEIVDVEIVDAPPKKKKRKTSESGPLVKGGPGGSADDAICIE